MPALNRLITFLLLSFFAISCGDAFMKKSEDKEGRFGKFAQCELNKDAFASIFKEKIQGDLLCLKENLNLFMDVVKTDRPGSLSLNELKLYITKNIQDVDKSVLDLLDAVFEINSLIMGDDREYIERSNVGKLVNLFIDINKVVVENQVYNFYADDSQISYKEHNRRKALVFEALSTVGLKINQVSIENDNYIDFEDFLGKFQNIDTDPGISKILKNLKQLLYIKKMFLGGLEKRLTSKELRRLATMIPDIAKVSFDLSNIKRINSSENEEEDIIETYAVGARSLVKNLFYKEDSKEEIFTLEDIFNTARIFGDNDILSWLKYRTEYLLAKEVLLDSGSSIFTAKEVYTLFNDIVYKNLERGVFIYKNYRLNRDLLNSADMIKEDLPNIIDLGGNDSQYTKDLNRIVKKYFFFKGKKVSAKFSRDLLRSALGIFEVATYEDFARRIFKGKAKQLLTQLPIHIKDIEDEIALVEESDLRRRDRKEKIAQLEEKLKLKKDHLKAVDARQLKGDVLTQETLAVLFEDYNRILIDQDIITLKRSANTAETITLMTSLFQAQSNGDSYIEIPEVTEFIVEVLSGMKVAEVGNKFFIEQCGEDKYSPECFRNNFVGFLNSTQEGSDIKSKLPGLTQYLEDEKTDPIKYLKVAEGFTRSCTHFDDGQPVPYSEGELMLVFTGMFAIEQTMIRFDVNNNNVLDEDEVDSAFEVYEGAIKGLIPVRFLEGSAKDFYLYLMKYKRLPDVQNVTGIRSLWRAIKEGVKFGAYVLFKKDEKKRTKADRETIATILKTLAELSPENINNPFPCEILR